MPKFFVEKFDFTIVEAGIIASLPNIVFSVVAPFLGKLFKPEHTIIVLLIGSLLMFVTHTSYLFLPD
jgi:hypothetical protein